MSVPFTRRGYVAVSITLTANSKSELLTAVNAILAAETGTADQVQAPGTARELNIQVDAGIDGGSAAAANDVLIGDGFLSTSRYGYLLHVGESRNYRSDINNVQVSGINLLSAGNQVVHVEIMA